MRKDQNSHPRRAGRAEQNLVVRAAFFARHEHVVHAIRPHRVSTNVVVARVGDMRTGAASVVVRVLRVLDGRALTTETDDGEIWVGGVSFEELIKEGTVSGGEGGV